MLGLGPWRGKELRSQTPSSRVYLRGFPFGGETGIRAFPAGRQVCNHQIPLPALLMFLSDVGSRHNSVS